LVWAALRAALTLTTSARAKSAIRRREIDFFLSMDPP
jgi:hypothetical protein